MKLTDYDIYSNLLREKTGMVIKPDHIYSLQSRLNPVAKKWGHNSLVTLGMALQGVPDEALIDEIINAMMEYDTSFFRNAELFDAITSRLIPSFKSKTINIWCAASSSGQEPYSVAIAIEEAKEKHPNLRYNILASDVSSTALKNAEQGVYSQFEVQRGLPLELLMKYFKQVDHDKWQISKHIQKAITFKPFNLLHSMKKIEQQDIIMCCNVLDQIGLAERKSILKNLSEKLTTNGFLILGKDDHLAEEELEPYFEKSSLHLPIYAAKAIEGEASATTTEVPEKPMSRIAAAAAAAIAKRFPTPKKK